MLVLGRDKRTLGVEGLLQSVIGPDTFPAPIGGDGWRLLVNVLPGYVLIIVVVLVN